MSLAARIRAARPQHQSGARRLPGPDSLCWPAAVAVAFTLSELLFVSVHMGLSWDETVYVSQVSHYAPAAYFDPARARGITLLVAPVTLLTSSIVALRVYLSVASGLGLFLALLAWRGLRPAWQLALAGLAFGGLWVAQYYGPQAMPDMWVALSALAATGLFLQAAARPGTRTGRWQLAGLAACVAFAALVRPGDAIFLAVPLVAAALLVRAWRRWSLPVAVVGGLVAGGADWVAEAYARFGGPLARLHAAGKEQGGLGLHFAAWAELRALNGPTLCRPCTVGWRDPVISLWWLGLPLLVWLGLLAARKAGRLDSSALATACGLSLGVEYLFLINYAAPRFLLPAYALLSIPVADCLGWLLGTAVRQELRAPVRTLVVFCLVAQLVVQHLVLDHEASGTVIFHNDYTRIVADLGRLGVHPPCLIKGEQFIPVAFYARCASASSAQAVISGRAPAEALAVLERPGVSPPPYARHWQLHQLPGTRILKLVAYLPPRSLTGKP
jgi:hypothetical protein